MPDNTLRVRLEKVINRFEFKASFSGMSLRVDELGREDCYSLRLTWRVPDVWVGNIIPLMSSRVFPTNLLKNLSDLDSYITHEIQDMVRSLILHEMDEALHFDGKHLVDPHPLPPQAYSQKGYDNT